MICELCGKEFLEDWRRDKATIKNEDCRFCSPSCARKYSSIRSKGHLKTAKCISCGKIFQVNSHTSLKYFKCDSCKTPQKIFKYPENTYIGEFERSAFYQRRSKSLEKLGFEFENSNIQEEYLKIQSLLTDEYLIQLKPAYLIEKKYGLAANTLTYKVFQLFGISKRDKGSVMREALIAGRREKLPEPDRSLYQHGIHIDWQGNSHYLRSSYEFEFASFLDSKKIEYETETIKIKYFDTQKEIYRIAVPDFYIPSTGEIIEIKGLPFYDPVNLTDRKKIIQKMGFSFKVILNKTLILEDFPKIEELKF